MATFGGNTAGTVTIADTYNASIGGLTFGIDGYVITRTNTGTLALAQNATITTSGTGASTVSAPITGAFNLTKEGAGTLILSGTNTYSKATVVNGGTLQIGNGAATGSIAGTTGVSVAANTLLSIKRSDVFDFPITISGAGGLSHDGTGTTTIANGNSYTGPTNINAGTLRLRTTSGNALSSGTTVTIAGSATMDLNGNGESFGALAGAGTVTNSSTTAAAVGPGQNNTSTTFSGVLQNGAGVLSLVKDGTGTLTLTGNSTYTGTTDINAGTLQIGGSGSLGWNGTVGVYAGAITNNAALKYSSSADQTLSGVISGTGSLVKDTSSSSTLTVSSFNTFSGGTTVNAGTLSLAYGNGCAGIPVQSDLGTGPLTVAANATLAINAASPLGCPMNDPTLANSVPQINLSGTITLDASSPAVSHLPLVIMNTGSNITSTGAPGSTAQLYGAYNFDAGVQVIGDSTLSASYVANRASNGVPFTISAGKTLTVSGYFGNATSGGVTNTGFSVAGGGTMLFSGSASSATGPITVSNGKIQIGNGGANGDISSFDSVNLSTTSGNLSFKRNDTYTFGKAISGSGNVSQDGSGTTTLTAVNTYSGTTSVNAGVLTIGVTNALNKNSAVTVGSGAKLSLGTSFSQELSNGLTADAGTLDLNGGTLTLSGGTSNIGTVTGSGTIVVGAGATLNLKKALSNTNISIQMAGGVLSLTGLTHSLGTLTQTVSSSIDFAGGGKLTVANIGATFTGTLTATNWTSTTGNFYASAVNGGPARNTAALAPLNQIQLGTSGNAALTYWATGTPGELRASSGSFTYWDKIAGNNQIDGGAGTWDGTLPNWANSTGSFNGTWAGGTSVATFGGTAGGIVTLGDNYSPSIGGLTFSTGGYTIARNVSTTGTLSLASNATVTLPGSGTTTINVPISGAFSITTAGTGTLTLGATNTFSGGLTIPNGVSVISTAVLMDPASPLTLSAGGTLSFNNSGYNVYSAPWNVAGTLEYNGASTSTIATYISNITFNQATVNVTGSSTMPSGALPGSGNYNDRLVLKGTVAGTGQANVRNYGTLWIENGTTNNKLAVAVDGTSRLSFYGSGNMYMGSLSGSGTMGVGDTGAGTPNISVGNDNDSTTFSGVLTKAAWLSNNTSNWGLTKAGTGTFTLSGVNTYTGGTTVSAGTLVLDQPQSGCSSPALSVLGSGALVIGAGAIVDVNSSSAKNNPFGCYVQDSANSVSAITLRGTLKINAAQSAHLPALTLDGGDLSSYNTPSASGTNYGVYDIDYAVAVNSTSTISAANVVNASAATGGTTYTVSPTATLNVTGYFGKPVSASITDTGFTLAGGGTMVLTGTNTSASGITVSNGKLQVGNGGTTGDIGSHSGVALSSSTAILSFNRSNAYTFSRVISGSGKVSQDGSSTTTLSGANTYTGTTTVNAGTLALGADNALPAASAVTVNANTTLALAGFNQSFTASLTVSGTLDMGSTGTNTLTLNGGTHSIAAIAGKGTIKLTGGATLTLGGTPGISNSNVNIQLDGGTLALGGKTHSLGTLTQTTTSTVDFAGGNSSLTVATLGSLGTGLTLTASNWTQGTTHFYATAVTGGPAKNQIGLAPLNQVKLGNNAATATYWSGTGNELLPMTTGTYTYWDTNASNTTVDGGPGDWDNSTLNWTTSSGTPNGTWAGGTNVATFAGTGAAVSVTSAQSMGGMTFNVDGYTLSGSTLTGAATSNPLTVTTTSHTATIGNVLAGTNAFTKEGAGTLSLTGVNTFTGGLTVNQGVLNSNGKVSDLAGAVTVKSGATLSFSSPSTFYQYTGAWDIAGTLTYSAASGAKALNQKGTLTLNDAIINVSGGSPLSTLGDGRLVLQGTTTGTGQLNLANFGDASLEYGANTSLVVSIDATSRLQIYAGTMAIGSLAGSGTVAAASTTTASLSVGNDNNNSTFAGVMSNTNARGNTQSWGLIKAGTGTFTLTGTSNTNTGATTVSGGTLLVNGSTASSAVSVAGGATLGGTGTVAGSVTVSGTLTAGATAAAGSVGILNTGALTFSGTGATLALDLGNNGTPGTDYDQIKVTGNLSLNGNLTLNKLTGFNTTGKYTLITYTGTRTGTFSANNLAAIGYQGVIQYDDVNKQVNLVSIPRVKITEVSNGATGTFNFAMTGLDTASASLTTTASGTPVSSSTFNGTVGTAVSITQTIPSGWPSTPASISCVDANGASTGNGTGALGTVSGVQVTLGTAQMVAGADITCTFTNTRNGISGAVFNDGGAPSGSTNTGTPNDGLQNGSEAGVGGITVNLTNCSGTTYASTTTDGNGAFGLSIPTAQIGQTVCVQPVLAANTLATGANAAGTVLPDGSATSVGGVGYTYTRASQQASFTAPASGTVTLNFGQVPVSTLTPAAGRQQGRPGLRALHPHTFTAGTGGALKVQLGTATATPSTVTGWSEAAYLDANCTGALDLSAQQLGASTTLTVVQGQQLCFLVHEQVPATAPEGSSNAVPVTATLTFTNAAPGLSASFAATDTTTVSNSALQLTKEVRNVTQGVTTFGPNNQAKSGEVLEYRIKYANTALSPINSLVISDTTPGYTTFVQAKTETTPTSLTACTKVTPVNAGTSSTPAVPVGCDVAQTAGGIGPITWTFTGTLSSGGEGAVLFQVKVD